MTDQLLGNEPDRNDFELREIIKTYQRLRNVVGGVAVAERLLRTFLIRVGARTLYDMRGKFRDELRAKLDQAMTEAQRSEPAPRPNPTPQPPQQHLPPPTAAPPKISTGGFVIQPNVPIPKPWCAKREWPFEAMKVGDSVLFLKGERSAAESEAHKMGKQFGVRFTFRRVDDAYARCWRIE